MIRSELARSLWSVAEQHASSVEVWERAEGYLLHDAFVERLASLGVEPTEEVATALLAAALLLAEHTPEFGGEARDAVAELALLAHSLVG